MSQNWGAVQHSAGTASISVEHIEMCFNYKYAGSRIMYLFWHIADVASWWPPKASGCHYIRYGSYLDSFWWLPRAVDHGEVSSWLWEVATARYAELWLLRSGYWASGGPTFWKSENRVGFFWKWNKIRKIFVVILDLVVLVPNPSSMRYHLLKIFKRSLL